MYNQRTASGNRHNTFLQKQTERADDRIEESERKGRKRDEKRSRRKRK